MTADIPPTPEAADPVETWRSYLSALEGLPAGVPGLDARIREARAMIAARAQGDGDEEVAVRATRVSQTLW